MACYKKGKRKNEKPFSFGNNCIVVFQWNMQQNAGSNRSSFRYDILRAIIKAFSPHVAVLNEYDNESGLLNDKCKFGSSNTKIFSLPKMDFSLFNKKPISLPEISCLIENDNYLFLGTHINHKYNDKNTIIRNAIESIKKNSSDNKPFFMIGDFNHCITTLGLNARDLIFPSSDHENMFEMKISITEKECLDPYTNQYLPSILECFVHKPVEKSVPTQTHLNVDPKKHSSSYDYFITNDKSHDWSIYYLDFSGTLVNRHKTELRKYEKQPRPSDHIPILVVGKPKTPQ